MINKVDGVSVVKIELLDKFCLTSPHEDIVLGVAQVGGQTGPEVACAEDQDFGVGVWLGF